MADDEEVIDREGIEEEIEEFAPGELCAVDGVTEEDKVDLEEEDDSGLTQEEKEGVLAELCNAATQRDLTSYRLEVRDAWKARYFWRGNQFLLPGRNGAWVLPQLILVGGQSYDDHNSETNIYLAFGDTIIASLTAGTPSVRFEPDDPTNPADVSAAENSEGARRLIERANNMIVAQEDLCRFLWTDSRCITLTKYVLDAQRFGYEQRSELEDELGYLPEEGEKIGEQSGEEEITIGRGTPRGQEVVENFGALESKIPMQASSIDECGYCIIAKERDITQMKTKYPKKAKDLQPMQTPTANTEYMRLARTSIMTGMRPSNMTNDAMTYNATEQWAWFRPSFYPECKDETKREWLYDTFPTGCYVAMVGKTVVEARREQMDDHITLTHCRPGDGSHRPALGSPLIPIQEKLNDCMDYMHDAYMHLVPLKWVDSEAVDKEALEELQTKPNQYVVMKRRPDKDMASNIFVEPQIQIAEGLMLYIQQLFGEIPQFLCGAFPALFGGDTGANDTAKGIAGQRDQALGRVGLTWRNLKASYARIVRQGVAAAAKFRNSPMSGEMPGAGGAKEIINVDPNDLKGNVRCYPDTDENFPESWVAQRGIWQGLMAAAAANPILAQVLQVPRNLAIAKDKVGLPELVIPAAAAAAKQQAEIMVLLEGEPVPNPALEQAKQAVQSLNPPPGTPPEQILMAQQKMAQAITQIPPLVSSVPIDEELDDHQNEMGEILTFANSPKGIKARVEKKDGFLNLRLHYDEHKRALAAKIAQQQGQGSQFKPVSDSVSVSFKDLPPEGQAQVAAKMGIQLNPQNLMAEDQLEKAHDIKALATTPKIPPGDDQAPGQKPPVM
jgi:hypothetical protein